MTHSYKITGMTCAGCQAKIQHLLSKVNGVSDVSLNLEKGDADITMTTHVPIAELKEALKDYPKYQISEKEIFLPKNTANLFEQEQKNWLETYKPILLIFGYICGVTLLIQSVKSSFSSIQWMNHFMAAFFLVFSFFKLLNLKGFVESYAMYDIVAKRIKNYGYLYAFIELGLGIAFLIEFNPLIVNTITIVVMSISIIGVLQSVLDKKKIKCACLGDVFNLPMSSITITEDALMIVMSAIMLVTMI